MGAVGGTALLAAVAGLASLPFLLSHPKPVLQTALQPKPEEKKAPVEEEVGAPPDKSPEKKPDASEDLREKKAPKRKPKLPKKPKHPAEKPQKIVPPKPAEPDKPHPSPRTRPMSRRNRKRTRRPPPNRLSSRPCPRRKPEPPVKKPEPPAKPVSLDGLAAAVDLPQPGKGANEAVSLGKLDLDPKLALDLQLLGGDTVAKGNPKFDLQKDGDGATPGWSVEMAEKKAKTP